jgi:[acyl-carrier-protein] S-malonyltransferase
MRKKIAFVFPGQGSQSIGMLADLAQHFPLIKQTFQEASDVLGYDVWALTQNGPVETLNQTVHTQPTLLTASVALWRVWEMQSGTQPIFMAGHSLGEYSALVCAKALAFTDAVKLVAERGRLMQLAVPEGIGGMAVLVGLDERIVEAICDKASGEEFVSPANYNSLGQIVIAGHGAAVERAIELAKEAGAKMARRLPVSVPSHCALMQPAATDLAIYMAPIELKTPQISVVNNANVAIPEEPLAIKEALMQQLIHPVRWVETIQWLAQQGIEYFIECGPGKVLTGLNKRIAANIPTICIQDSASLEQALIL